MSVSCIRNCKPGDIIHVFPGNEYLVTNSYVDKPYPGTSSSYGHVLLHHVATKRDTFLPMNFAHVVTKIIKRPNEVLPPKL